PAASEITATQAHIVSSPKAFRTCRPPNGARAHAIAQDAPKTPMYAPRMSAGAMAATTACEVGIQSISPKTKSRITTAAVGTVPESVSNRNGAPISGNAIAVAPRKRRVQFWPISSSAPIGGAGGVTRGVGTRQSDDA